MVLIYDDKDYVEEVALYNFWNNGNERALCFFVNKDLYDTELQEDSEVVL